MATTDRGRIKDQQKGMYLTTEDMSDADAAVRAMHSRQRDFLKTGTENAATNVAESPMFSVERKSKVRAIGIATGTNVAADGTDYVLLKFFKRKAATSTLVGSWNTHSSAQGAITTSGPARIVAGAGLITNSDAEIDEASNMTYSIEKYGTGQAIAALSTFSVDLEEI